MTLFTGIDCLLSLKSAAKKLGRNIVDSDLSPIADAAFLVKGERIVWVGTAAESKSKTFQNKFKVSKIKNLKAKTVLPAFVDCHTHTIFAGNRHDEFEMRNQGYSYQEIADKGGGIVATVKATRKATDSKLINLARKREAEYLRQGVATLEVKSGYGLDKKNETKILRVAKSLKKIRVVPTFLGAHAVPEEFTSAAEYLQELLTWLPSMRKLAARIDIFLEKSYFGPEEAKKLFKAAKEHKFDIVAHTDQLNPTGASVMAARAGAISVDHCVRIKDDELAELAQSLSTCVLLPASDFYLHLPYPPARRLIEAGARVALATDFNPGSAPSQDLSFTGVLARLEMKMKLAEVIVGLTLNGIYALGLQDDLGSIEVGKIADFVVLDGEHDELFVQVGQHPVRELWRSGRPIFQKK